jgi:ferredoxin
VRVSVDWGLCESNALCEGVAPEVFSVGDDDVLVVHDDAVDATERDLLENAVTMCPKQALRLTE